MGITVTQMAADIETAVKRPGLGGRLNMVIHATNNDNARIKDTRQFSQIAIRSIFIASIDPHAFHSHSRHPSV